MGTLKPNLSSEGPSLGPNRGSSPCLLGREAAGGLLLGLQPAVGLWSWSGPAGGGGAGLEMARGGGGGGGGGTWRAEGVAPLLRVGVVEGYLGFDSKGNEKAASKCWEFAFLFLYWGGVLCLPVVFFFFFFFFFIMCPSARGHIVSFVGVQTPPCGCQVELSFQKGDMVRGSVLPRGVARSPCTWRGCRPMWATNSSGGPS